MATAIKTVSLDLGNGSIVLGYDRWSHRFHVLTSDQNISTYSHDEMEEIYGFVPENTDLLGTQVR